MLMGHSLKYRYEITYPHIFNVRYNRMWDTGGAKNKLLLEISKWCKENASSHYEVIFDTDHSRSNYMDASFKFHTETDAIKFKLTWCGDGNDKF